MTAPTGPFFVRGVTKYFFLPSVANLAAPSRAEINAGTPLTKVTAVSGFKVTRSFIDTPDLDSDFTGNVPGERKADSSSLTFKDERGDTTIRDALPDGTTGVILKMPYGDYAGDRCECWPVISGGVNDDNDMSSFGKYMIDFATPEPPELNAVIPA